EIQFEYTAYPPILTISDWCAEKFDLPVVIVNPFENEKLLKLIDKSELALFDTEFQKTTSDSPVAQLTININIDGELRLHRAYCRVNWSYDDEPKILSAIGKIVDIEDDHQEMQKLKRKAATDTLTKLYNHNHAKGLMNKALRNKEKNYALILFDIDNFKDANDTFGHLFGDTVLKNVADTLSKISDVDDIYARIGGDEFLMFIEYQTMDALEKTVSRIHKKLNSIKLDTYNTKVSAGIATTEQSGYNYTNLFNDADSALYYSKNNGKSKYTFYDKSESE
nr:GGDEF domain-containing protein [Eubacterium sp.]